MKEIRMVSICDQVASFVVQQAIEEHGLSLKQVAQVVGRHSGTIRRKLNCQSKWRMWELVRIFDAFGMSFALIEDRIAVIEAERFSDGK